MVIYFEILGMKDGEIGYPGWSREMEVKFRSFEMFLYFEELSFWLLSK